MYSSFLNQGIVKVNGFNGAQMYQMQPNQMVALFDANQDVFYIKTTDGAGFPTIQTYKFKEVTNSNNDYVSREDFNELKEDLNYVKQYIQQPAYSNFASGNKSSKGDNGERRKNK